MYSYGMSCPISDHFTCISSFYFSFVQRFTSKQFSFMNGQIEFSCGMDRLDDSFYITFGFEDNSSHMLEVKCDTIDEWFDNNLEYSR